MSERTERLRADCEGCVGLCCVALPFTASSDFAVGKAAGEPCRNLTQDHRCGIHDRLRESGFSGCVVFDCYGAGQRVTARQDVPAGPGMFAVFRVTRQLHELLWYLAEAVERGAPATLYEEVDALAGADADTLADLDVNALRARVGAELARVSEAARAGLGGRELRGADKAGARLRGAALRGASLRGALLIAADLREADLRTADLLGADLRDADLRGADLTGCLFLTQPQLEAAHGDSATALPTALRRPAHWSARPPHGQHEAHPDMSGQSGGKSPRGGGGRNGGGNGDERDRGERKPGRSGPSGRGGRPARGGRNGGERGNGRDGRGRGGDGRTGNGRAGGRGGKGGGGRSGGGRGGGREGA